MTQAVSAPEMQTEGNSQTTPLAYQPPNAHCCWPYTSEADMMLKTGHLKFYQQSVCHLTWLPELLAWLYKSDESVDPSIKTDILSS